MAKRRIIKETLESGKVQYRIEVKLWYSDSWSTDSIYDGWYDCEFAAVFNTLEEAKIYCDIPINQVIQQEIVYES